MFHYDGLCNWYFFSFAFSLPLMTAKSRLGWAFMADLVEYGPVLRMIETFYRTAYAIPPST